MGALLVMFGGIFTILAIEITGGELAPLAISLGLLCLGFILDNPFNSSLGPRDTRKAGTPKDTKVTFVSSKGEKSGTIK